MKLKIGAIAGLVMVVMAVMIAISYGTAAFGALDSGTNLTGTAYEDQYDTAVESSQAAMGLLDIIPIVAAVLAILLGVVMFRSVMR